MVIGMYVGSRHWSRTFWLGQTGRFCSLEWLDQTFHHWPSFDSYHQNTPAPYWPSSTPPASFSPNPQVSTYSHNHPDSS